jgi:PKD repeat protein
VKAKVGKTFSYQIRANNNPTSFAATGLPRGLKINAKTGLISGKPAAAGEHKVSISATNSGGAGTAKLTIQISTTPTPASTPAITSALSVKAKVGKTFSYQIRANNNPTSFAATGLPRGLKINAKTGLISGKPAAAGKSKVSISATNSRGTGRSTLTIQISSQP